MSDYKEEDFEPIDIENSPFLRKKLGGDITGVRATTPEDKKREGFGKTAALAEILGGLGGNFLAGPLGGFGMTGAINYANQVIRKKLYPLEEDPSVTSALLSAGLNEAATAVPLLGKTGLRKVTGTVKRPKVYDLLERMRQKYGMEFTVGQLTQKGVPNTLESVLTGSALRDIEVKQYEQIVEEVIPSLRKEFNVGLFGNTATRSEYLGRLAQIKLEQKQSEMLLEAGTIYQRIKNLASNKKQLFLFSKEKNPTPVQIEGPVQLNEAKSLAESLKPQLDAFIEGADFEKLPPDSWRRSHLLQAKDAVDNILASKVTNPLNGEELNIIPYEKAREFKITLNKLRFIDEFNDNGRRQAGLIAKSLEEDTKQGILAWGGPQELAAYEKANKIYQREKNIFTGNILKLFGKRKSTGGTFETADPQDLFNYAFASPTAVRKVRNAMGIENQHILQAEFFERVLKRATTDVEGVFNPDQGIKLLDSDVAEVLFKDNPNLKQNLKDLFKTIGILGKPSKIKPGEVALAIREGGLVIVGGSRLLNPRLYQTAIAGGTGVAGVLGGIGAALAVPATGFGIIVPARQFTRRILLNPEAGKRLIALAKLKPYSPEAIRSSKYLLGFLKGTQVLLELPSGGTVSAYVNQKGEVTPNYQRVPTFEELPESFQYERTPVTLGQNPE